MSLYKDASLVMIPSAYKDGKLYSIRPTDGSGDFTFSRGSNLAATRVDVNGLIEKGRENVMPYSNDFSNAAWVKSNVTLGNVVSGPLAGVGGRAITINAGGLLYAYGTTPFSLGVGSAYMRCTSGSVELRIGDPQGNPYETKTISTSWERYSFLDTTDLRGFAFYNPSASSINIEIAAVQTEQGLVATDYIETGTSAAQSGILEDMPRLDYSGGASCPSLLLEPQRTNAITYSEDFSNILYAKTNASITSGFLSPEGTNNATKLTTSANNGQLIFSAGGGNTNTKVVSVFAKANTSTSKFKIIEQYYSGQQTLFDLNLGVVEFNNSAGSKIENFGNGWFRCTHIQSYTSGQTNSTFAFRTPTAESLFLYGAQLEQGSYPTSYIPTYGTSQTRSSDSTSHIDVSSLGVTTGYTLFYELGNYNVSTASSWLAQGGTNGRAYEVYGTTAIIKTTSGDVYPFNHGLTGTEIKVAVNYDGININVFTNGTKRGTWAANQTIWNGITNLDMTLNNLQMVNWKQLLVFPTALTDSECIALTTL